MFIFPITIRLDMAFENEIFSYLFIFGGLPIGLIVGYSILKIRNKPGKYSVFKN